MITTFTPLQSLIGGALLGLAATLLMLLHGRIAGVTGIIRGVLPPVARDWQWRAAFLVGMVAAPMLYALLIGQRIVIDVATAPTMLLASGAIVGLGVSYGAGCPSGHGICGLARLSPRSLAAVATFMATAAATVFATRHLLNAGG